VEMMEERGLLMAHTTIMRWVHQYGPELDTRIRPHLRPTNDSWRVDETYIKVSDWSWSPFLYSNRLPPSPSPQNGASAVRNLRIVILKHANF